MKTLRRACTAPLLALALACAPADDPPSDAADPRASPAVPVDTVSEATVRDASPAAYGSFGLRLFRGVEGASSGGNVFLSPVSAGVALSLAYHGAEGETRDEMARALGFGGMGAEEVARANAAARAALASPALELRLASALWAREGAVFRPAYLEVARRSYGAEVAAIDFTNPAAAKARIDAWVSGATHGRIPGLSGELDPSTLLLITNAIYFKGKWADEFEPEATRPLPFHRLDGSTVQAPMMSRVGGYGYVEGEGFRAVRMPYLGGRFAMYVFLPDSGSTPRALADALDAARWDGWMRGFEEREVALTLPRFTWRGGMDLTGPLREMGMRRAFDHADFGGMLEPAWLAAAPGGRVFVEGVFQQAFVEVTEEGTEAAAVTEIPIAMDSVATPPPTSFVADRPFLFAIRDDRTGALLFIGQINDPTATQAPAGG